jgi:general secretion pathway protein B
MSFILDALKKSETDRQQKSTAEFSTVPAGSAAPRAPRWLWLLAALLAINALAIAWLLLTPDSPQPVPVVESVAASAGPVARPQADAPAPSFEQRVADARAQQPPPAETGENTAEPDAGPSATPAPASEAARSPARSGLPTLLDLQVGGEVLVPQLHLDIHVFSDVPADRFVFINMNKHREGSTLNEGPSVIEITVDGVVLEHRGRRFMLPRE